MPPIERDAPVDPLHTRHQHSMSIDGRALIPMWDSSDPERAPPPLPLNPQSPSVGVGTSRIGTSPAIQSAHAALNEKARESALVPSLHKRSTDSISSDRALVPRSSPHKRTQTLGPSSVRDLGFLLDSAPRRDSFSSHRSASPEKQNTRPSTPIRGRENERAKSVDRDPPTPLSASLTPVVRPTVRRPHQSILGENTPPQSATMLALQNMPSPASKEQPAAESPKPLANVTNNSTALTKSPPTMDFLSTQLLTLTNIATALQKEMNLLSRRSRDNATDLMSLKEATHARDEDIRKSLREMMIKAEHTRKEHDPFGGGLLLEHKPLNSPDATKSVRPFSLPRIPSLTSFAASIDRETNMATPSLVGGDSPATLALLEKIIRDMTTKDGLDTITERLAELAANLTGMASGVKVEELIKELKSTNEHLSLVPAGGGRGGGGNNSTRSRNFSFDEDDDRAALNWSQNSSGSAVSHRINAFIQDKDGRRSSVASAGSGAVLNEDVIKVIRGVKDSVAQGGGLTAEVKALVRELRGEVLGMGRELGRRIDEVNAKVAVSTAADTNEPATKIQMEKIVIEGLDQMRQRMTQLLREHRRESTESTKTIVDYQQIYDTLKDALREHDASQQRDPEVSREDVINAVREAWEDYKPEIHVEQIGLERDEVLACLKEGFHEYAPRDTPRGATRDEVFQAIVEGLKHFTPPQVDTPESLSRDEVIEAVRECLEEFEFPVAPSALNNELTREGMVQAVKEGLDSFDFPSMANAMVPHTGNTDSSEIMERLHDIMQALHEEFKAVSEEAKQNVAASGRDTEQVLDATKDGFEQLRIHMEGYVNRVSTTTGQDELMETLVKSLDGFKAEIEGLLTQASEGSKAAVKEEVESLRDTVNGTLVPHAPPATDNKEVLDTLKDGLERVRVELMRPHAGTTEILDAMSEGFNELRDSVEKIGNKPADLTANDEILDALKAGLDTVKSEIETLREQTQNYNEKAVAPVGAVVSDAIIPVDVVKQDDIKNLELLLTQLRIKIEAMEQPAASEDHLSKSDLSAMEELIRSNPSKDDLTEIQELLRNNLSKSDLSSMEEMLRNVQESVAGMAQKDASKDAPKEGEESEEKPANLEGAATKDDVLAIETILRNTKSRLDDLIDGEQAVRKDHIDAIETLVLETKASLELLTISLETVSKKEDIQAVESLVTQVTAALDEMKERAEKSLDDPERVTKTDVDAVEAVCLDIKSIFEQMLKSDIAALPSKDDLKAFEDAVKEAITESKTVLDAQVEANAKAFEERQAEIVGVSERVTEVKTFFEEFQTLVKEKLENETSGLEALGKALGTIGEAIEKNATVAEDLKSMSEIMKTEFEDSKAGVVGAKLDNDEKLQAAADALQAKIDEKVGELITRYEAFELVMDERNKSGETRDVEMEAAVVGTKAVADELKALIDTLGSTVTESMEKMEEASKTVFTRVEELFTKSEENHSDDKNEHSTTRDQVKAAVTVVEGLQGYVVENQPKILEAVNDVLLIVGQHFEHSKTTITEMQKTIEDVKDKEPELPQLPPPEKYDDTEVHTKLDRLVEKSDDAGVHEKLDRLVEKSDDTGVHEKLDKLVEISDNTEVHTKLDKLVEKSDDTEVHTKLDKLVEKSDDTEVHAKLDKLVDHNLEADKAYAQLETLDKVHAQVVQTAAEITSFLEAQTKRIEEAHEDHAKALEETKVALEESKKTLEETNITLAVAQAEKEHVTANVDVLRTEEELLRESIMALKAEQEDLIRQRTRAVADLSSLETAVNIRREELHEIEDRAEGLERRILQGVLDHSRALLMAKSGPKSRDVMSRKRVPTANRRSLTPVETTSLKEQTPTPSPSVTNTQRKAVKLAVGGNRANLVPSSPAGTSRRVLSLSQITNNVATGGIQRSQSVRAVVNSGVRKSSWGGSGAAKKKYGDLGDGDKENEPIDSVREIDEPDENGGELIVAEITPPESPTEELEADIDDAATEVPTTESDAGEPEDDEGPKCSEGQENGEEGGDDTVSEAGTLRRSSLGTTVITTTETENGDYSDDDDDQSFDDQSSQWTESAVETESMADTESVVDSLMSSNISDGGEEGEGGEGGELVLHAG